MRIFVDECVNHKLMPHLTGHSFTHTADTDWLSTQNGALLRLVMQHGFDVFLTTDKNIKHQQNLSKLALAFVVMRPRSNNLEDLLPLVPEVLATLAAIDPTQIANGELYEIFPP